jgi:hypothetical protein
VHGVADVGLDHPIRAAVDEAGRRIVAVLHLADDHVPVDWIVRHVDACAEGGAAARPRNPGRVQVEAADLEHFLSAELRRRERKVDAGGLAHGCGRIAPRREESADVRLPPESPLRSHDGEVLARYKAAIARAHLQDADVERPRMSRQLRAVINRLRHAGIIQADAAAEERHDRVARLA